MKIAVCGIGVAGSYLISRLKDLHEVVGFERMSEDKHDSICAWGTTKSKMTELCKKSGIDFNNYVIHDGKNMHIEMNNNEKFDIKLHGLCTYDKIQLIKDFVKGCKINYGTAPKLEELEKEFDLIVDCTGFHRVYLPRLEEDFFLPTYEYKVEYKDKVPYDDFLVRPFAKMTGYFWYFPLGEKFAHIGAGDYKKNHIKATDEFLKKHKCEIIKKVGRPVRISPPKNSEPFTDGRKTVGVGESIGTVYPLLGEGIIPSTWCAELFIKHINDFNVYRKEVLKKFQIYSLVFKFIQMKINGKFDMFKNVIELLKIYKEGFEN